MREAREDAVGDRRVRLQREVVGLRRPVALDRADRGAQRHLEEQRRGDVERRQRLRGALDRIARGDDQLRQALECFELDAERAVAGARDLRLELAELGRGEPHLAGERLAVNERGVERRCRQLVGVLRGHLDEIAEHVVVADFQGRARRCRRRTAPAALQ